MREWYNAINSTHFEHATITLLLGVVFTLVFLCVANANLPVVAGISVACAVFFGREHAQNQRTTGSAVKALKFWKWNKDAQLDFYFPVLTGVLIEMLWQLAGKYA